MPNAFLHLADDRQHLCAKVRDVRGAFQLISDPVSQLPNHRAHPPTHLFAPKHA